MGKRAAARRRLLKEVSKTYAGQSNEAKAQAYREGLMQIQNGAKFPTLDSTSPVAPERDAVSEETRKGRKRSVSLNLGIRTG